MIAQCARCGREFERRRSDHRFCSRDCRYLGERDPSEDTEAIERLFDPRRSKHDLVDDDDWAPAGDPFIALDGPTTVAQRRRLYQAIRDRRARWT